LAAIEGTNIIIGEDCLFSSGIVFRTGDSHSVTDLSGNRTNPSKDITIGNHVWIGHRVFVNKGVEIGENNILGTAAVVTKSITEKNCVIAGVPAKVVKTDVNWKSER
jgi:acetyltransferase-like isoleucine patch superfamily enzyme